MAEHAGTGYWIPILITGVFFAIVTIIITKLNNAHKNKMIYEYSKDLVGSFFSYIIALFYLIYILQIIVYLVLQLSIILQANFMQKTPISITMLVGIPVYCYIAYKGINTIARMFEFFGAIYIVLAVIVHLLMLTQGQFHRILPLLNIQEMKKYLSAIKYSIFPFLGVEVLLFIPFNKRNGTKVVKKSFYTIIIIAFFYILNVGSCIMKLGLNSIIRLENALIVAIRDMNIPMFDFLKRLDVLFLTVGFIGFFMGISILYTILTELILKIFPKIKRGVVVLIIGAISYLLCLVANTIYRDFAKYITNVGVLLGLVATVFIPTILFIITKVKKNEV
jgi:spore germination protein